MKKSLNSLIGFTLGAVDGEIGKIKEFYFDDKTWTVRYLIVKTGGWFSEKDVLISPQALLSREWDAKVLPVNLTMEKIQNSPDIDTEKPVSRQEEIKLNEYYPWPNYWGMNNGPWIGGMGTSGMMLENTEPFDEAIRDNVSAEKTATGNPDLRNTGKVEGYAIKAIDAEIGEVADFIIDDSTWKIDFLVVDTGNWFPGKQVLISPNWIEKIEWVSSTIEVKTLAETIKNSPEYHHGIALSEAYEVELNEYYKVKK